ncbi:MAG: hypothetical protein WCP17_01320 [bacterium]
MRIKFFNRRNSFKKKGFVFNPNFYWRIAIFVAILGVIFSFFFGYSLFKQINQESVVSSTANESAQTPPINKNRTAKALEFFSKREKKSIEIINSPAPVVDPSL